MTVKTIDHVQIAAPPGCEEAAIVVTEDDSLPGAERFYVADPWGNRLEFLHVE